MTVEEEKEALRRRLAELEEGETLEEKKLALKKVKVDFRKQREIARAEIFKLEQKIKVLQTEEEKKSAELEKEIYKINVKSCLECPMCLEVCKPPLQVTFLIISLHRFYS